MRQFVMGASVALFALSLPLHAQLELITYEHPFRVRSLAGVVVDPTGAPVSGVVVEECDASFSPRPVNDSAGNPVPMLMLWDCDRDPKHIMTSTTTDCVGHFAFPDAKKAKAHYLHLNLDGFDPMQVVVKVSRFARSELHIRMHVAT